jgi:Na+/H+ antiporter NhaC
MQALWLAEVKDDTIFIITLVVVLLVVIAYLVLGRDETIRLKESKGEEGEGKSEFEKKVIHKLDRSNDLLVSIRNSLLILVVLVVLVGVLLMLFFKGCAGPEMKSSVHVVDRPNTYN